MTDYQWREPTFVHDYAEYQDDICTPLTAHFGCEFGLINTGGWCVAIGATLEGGDQLLITDAYDTLSPMPIRHRCWRNDREILGYSVGFYPRENNYAQASCMVIFPKCRDAQGLAIAIRACLSLATAVRAGRAKFGAELVL